MRRILVGALLVSVVMPVASIATAVEPVTVGELGRACATDIGNLQVELRATQIQAGKLQVEVDKLKEAAKTKEPVKE